MFVLLLLSNDISLYHFQANLWKRLYQTTFRKGWTKQPLEKVVPNNL